MPDTFLASHTFNVSDLTPFPTGFQNSLTNSLQPGEYDANQDEKEANIQEQEGQTHGEDQNHEEAQAHSNQRITRSMAKSLGRDCQMKSLFVISLV